MPRIVDLSPVQAIGAAAQAVYQNQQNNFEQQLAANHPVTVRSVDPNTPNVMSGAYADMLRAQSGGQGAPAASVNDLRNQQYANMPRTIYGDEQTDQQGQTVYRDPSSGNSYRVNPQQARTLKNIDAAGLAGENRQSAINSALGIRDPDVVQYTDLTGRSYNLPQREAAARAQRDYAIKQGQTQFDQKMKQQELDRQSRETVLSQKMDLATNVQFDRLERDRIVNKLSKARAVLKSATDAYRANPYDDTAGKQVETANAAVQAAYDDLDKELTDRIRKRQVVQRRIQGKSESDIRQMGGSQQDFNDNLEELYRQKWEPQPPTSQPGGGVRAGTIANGPGGPIRFNGSTWEPYTP